MCIKQILKQLYSTSLFVKIRSVFFVLSEKLLGYPKLKKLFKERTGYSPDLKNPKSFNEKINWKKIHDRNPLLPITADKYRVRDYINSVLGPELSERVLIPLLYVSNKPTTIPFDHLPDEYIIKVNHGSGTNIIIKKGMKLDPVQVIEQCVDWLKKPYGFRKHEWAYQKIDRKIIIEPLIRDENGELPKDYKFYMINGICRLVHIDFGRFTERSRSLFCPEKWTKIDGELKFRNGPMVEKPQNFDLMLNLAKKLSKDFDFVRVDLYSVFNKVYFGELTHYPGSGMEEFRPRSLDYDLGSYWHIGQQ